MITIPNSMRVGLQKQMKMAIQSARVYINTIAISCFSFINFWDIVFHKKNPNSGSFEKDLIKKELICKMHMMILVDKNYVADMCKSKINWHS